MTFLDELGIGALSARDPHHARAALTRLRRKVSLLALQPSIPVVAAVQAAQRIRVIHHTRGAGWLTRRTLPSPVSRPPVRRPRPGHRRPDLLTPRPRIPRAPRPDPRRRCRRRP